MYKEDFLNELRHKLSGLPEDDLEERISFYSEIIDDRMEDGLSEEDAVAGTGTADEIAAQILSGIPLAKIVREKVKKKRSLRVWEILLLILGSPVWLSLLIAAFAVLVSVYIVLWAVVVAVYVIDLALAAAAVCCLAGAFICLIKGNPAGAGFAIGAGLVCAGLSILVFFVCVKFTKGVLKLTGKILVWIKSLFMRRK